ncbi:hypothetical protein BDN70DRAFT_793929 [Pholiota conissans]|uniref:Armadillo-like helical domain-containing protein n=1 Tax=Pholiota conissans TaxID=109636 RepID=A0A9P5ZFS2_9AGAR|nr:hypothetical protein BDN70DRAFT_793929 [Pholiota conissans]
MNNHLTLSHGSSIVSSKFVVTYSKLFQGIPPSQINPLQDQDRFFADLLDLKIHRSYLQEELDKISKEACLGKLKPFLSTLFENCIFHVRSPKRDDIRKHNAMETQTILFSRILTKNLTGWEIMEIFAGSLNQSDAVFLKFSQAVEGMIGDTTTSASLRHQALQLALTFICGVAQLSPGAYFLRQNFFSSIVSVVKDPEMEQYTFEAILLLAILANYHKSDAATLNPYLKLIKESTDGKFMRKLCWASNFTLGTCVKAYQDIEDDSVSSTLVSSFGSVINRLRPGRAFSFTTSTMLVNKFIDQPIEAAAVLLPLYEFLKSNPLFPTVLMENLISPPDNSQVPTTPLPCTLISLASYLCAHASSVDSSRSIAYARLSVNILLVLVENNMVMEYTIQTKSPTIRLCRQKLPALPVRSWSDQEPICSVIDCCIIWIRHNLQKRLEVSSYTDCIWICYRIIWFLQNRRLRLNYDWTHLWTSILSLLSFLVSRLDSLHTTGGVELLITETLRLFDLALCTSESYLSSPRALHELIYELVRSSSVLKRQEAVLKELALPYPSAVRSPLGDDHIEDILAHIIMMADFYEDKIARAGTGIANANDVMKIIAAEIEANGLHGTRELDISAPM